MKSMIALLFSFLALVQLALSAPAVDVDGRVAALEQHVKVLTLAQKIKALEEEAVDEKFVDKAIKAALMKLKSQGPPPSLFPQPLPPISSVIN